MLQRLVINGPPVNLCHAADCIRDRQRSLAKCLLGSGLVSIDALSSSDLQIDALTAGALGEIGPQARAAIPVMQRRLADTNVMVRVGAADVLGKLGAEPSVFMPMLVESLRDPDFSFLDFKLEVLLKHKNHGRDALPILMNILTNAESLGSPTNIYVRQQVTGALLQLQPTLVPRPGHDAE